MRSLLRRLALCLSCIALAIWYSHATFYRDPGSVFFDPKRAFEQKYSQYRKAEVQKFVDTGDGIVGKAGKDASLCVALSSVRRQHSQYLETTIGSLIHGLTAQERADLHLTTLIAESDPEKHPSWHSEWTQSVVDQLYSYSVSATQLLYIAELEQEGSYAEKGVYDYTTAMEECYKTGTPYIGMFEDDILLADGWLVRTLQGLKQIPPMTEAGKVEWLFMRLFNQERSTGWSNRYIGGNNEHWIIIGVGLAVSAIAALARRRYRWACVYLDHETVGVLVLVFIPAMVILFFQAGKASLLPPSPGVFNEPYGCCSQAMVFPREAAPVVIQYLRKQRAGQVDLLLDKLAATEGLTRYAMYPVQAQHIGLDSARMTLEKEAQAIWSMAYEDFNPIKLKRDHGRMLREYYGSPT